jgi:hypothetical protein
MIDFHGMCFASFASNMEKASESFLFQLNILKMFMAAIYFYCLLDSVVCLQCNPYLQHNAGTYGSPFHAMSGHKKLSMHDSLEFSAYNGTWWHMQFRTSGKFWLSIDISKLKLGPYVSKPFL